MHASTRRTHSGWPRTTEQTADSKRDAVVVGFMDQLGFQRSRPHPSRVKKWLSNNLAGFYDKAVFLNR